MEAAVGPLPPPSADAVRATLAARGTRAAILVEGWSDEAALQALARRRGIDLAAECIAIVPTGGVTNIAHFVRALGPGGLGLRLAGLCDRGEAAYLLRALQRRRLDGGDAPADLAAIGFFVCDVDLEDELIRALGVAAVERVIEAEGEHAGFRSFQAQPAQRGRDAASQLRRFIGTRAGRKIRYGARLVETLDLDRVPRPLDAVLARARGQPA